MCGCSGCKYRLSQNKPDLGEKPDKESQGQNCDSSPSHFVGIQSCRTDPEGQSSDVEPLDPTQGNIGHRGGIQGQRHIAGDMGSESRIELSISRSASKSVIWCSRSLLEFHGGGLGSYM